VQLLVERQRRCLDDPANRRSFRWHQPSFRNPTMKIANTRARGVRNSLAGFLFAALSLMILSPAPAAASAIDGTWLLAGRVAIAISDCQGAICGRIVWLRNPALRTPDMCGRTIVWGLVPDGPSQWTNGWVFDPEDGRTYHLIATQQSADTIQARMYAGMRLFGETRTLTRIMNRSLAGWC
jgi:uncharacterized protein (DUF2147 family)